MVSRRSGSWPENASASRLSDPMSDTEFNRDIAVDPIGEPDPYVPDPTAPDPTGSGPGLRDRARLGLVTGWPDLLLAGLLSAATFFVHDVGCLFFAPVSDGE